ncbi:universal stress protein [Nesterenkonia alkaliphila]|uniref:Universal stress protein n=1 Tax=Nesterenkonia alkaliphila TaxID=1463631 RepID=A0A7K1UKW8_9MICC|nr:universal stress protein [Nesterenkonia alkaliphila]MVT27135.1 universal stress protein [Nesterenkonia alkaliphila]GFZ97730.1 universal stress protein UspA [Nesterenkonia alkaliphila]
MIHHFNGTLGVLVGFDASEHAVRALHWAAAEALRRELPLTVMTAFTVPRAVSSYTDPTTEITGHTLARQGAEETLQEARDLLEGYPGSTQFQVEYGDAAGVLVAHSAHAEIAVVGARGRGGFIGRVLGSVSSALPAHASCPTVVVDRNYELSTGENPWVSTDERPVTVGMDSSHGSKLAALRAAEVAAAHGVSLRIVLAVPPLDGALLWYPELGPREEEHHQRQRELEDRLQLVVRWLSGHFEHLVISCAVIDGLPVEVLRAETSSAQLTVVGTRGRTGMASALLGSTSSSLLMHAAGPVMVVPEDEDPRLPHEDSPEAHAPAR